MHKCCGAMASVRRPTIAPPQRKRAPIRRLLSEEQRREVLDAFELFDIVRAAHGCEYEGVRDTCSKHYSPFNAAI